MKAYSVVVGLDFKPAGGFAFESAARMASAIPGSQIHLVHVFEKSKELDEAKRKDLIAHLRLYVNETAAAIGGLSAVTVGIHLRVGDPTREIIQLATDIDAKLIVVGAHKKPDLTSWLLGSVARRLLDVAPCPVFVAGPKPASAMLEPHIEPPCADCERVRVESKHATWWCERHAKHAARAHVFSYEREIPLATHDSQLIPNGIEF